MHLVMLMCCYTHSLTVLHVISHPNTECSHMLRHAHCVFRHSCLLLTCMFLYHSLHDPRRGVHGFGVHPEEETERVSCVAGSGGLGCFILSSWSHVNPPCALLTLHNKVATRQISWCACCLFFQVCRPLDGTGPAHHPHKRFGKRLHPGACCTSMCVPVLS